MDAINENSLGVDTISDDMLKDLSNDYADFLSVDLHKERQQFHEVIDDLLTKLDEYISFTDLIKSDVNLALDTTLENIQVKSRDMSQHFDRIDRLEAFMAAMKRNVGELEVAVEKAESDMGTFGSIKKAFSGVSLPSLFTPKSQARPPVPSVSAGFRPIRVLSTDDFFPKQTADSPEENSTSAFSNSEDRLNSDDRLQSETTASEMCSPVSADITALDSDVMNTGASRSNVMDSQAVIEAVDIIGESVTDKSDVILNRNDGEDLAEKVTEGGVVELSITVA